VSRGSLALLAGGLAVALLIVLLLAPNASTAPDGLERVAADEGFADAAEEAPFELLPGYSVPGIDNEAASRVLAGLVGTLAVTAIALGGGWALRRRTLEGEPPAEAGEPAREDVARDSAVDAPGSPASRQP
jgi:hypothetical protein